MAVPVHLGWLKSMARLREIVQQKFNEELRTLFTVDNSDKLPLARGIEVLEDGDALFLPGVDQVLVQPSPSPDEIKGAQRIVIYIGPSRASETNVERSVSGAGYEREAFLPFAATVVFNQAPFAAPVHWLDGTELSREEVMTVRAACYIGALEHTIAKYGCQHEAIDDTTPLSDLLLSGGIQIVGHEGEENELLAASVWHEFGVFQDQLWPTHTKL